MYVEECRLYEIPQSESGRNFSFELVSSSGNNKLHLAAETLNEMRDWMDEIRISKKKKLMMQIVRDNLNQTMKKLSFEDNVANNL
jgi:hypothetical protein